MKQCEWGIFGPNRCAITHRIRGWALGQVVLWAINQWTLAMEATEHSGIVFLGRRGHLGGQTVKTG